MAGIIGLVFRLPLRQTIGFLSSLVKLMRLNLRVPDYSTISRRPKKIDFTRSIPAERKGMHIIVDLTGLSVCDADEFRKTYNGLIKFKGYRMLHIAINEHQEILACELTDKHANAQQQIPKLLKHLSNTYNAFIADGSYDNRNVYNSIAKHKRRKYIKVNGPRYCDIIIPLRINAWPRKTRGSLYLNQRSDHIRCRNQLLFYSAVLISISNNLLGLSINKMLIL